MIKRRKDEKQILQLCLEKLRDEGRLDGSLLAGYPEQEGRLRPLLEAAKWLRSGERLFSPRPGFIEASRRRVVARIMEPRGAFAGIPGRWRLVTQRWLWRLGRLRFAMQVALITLLALAVFSNGMRIVHASRTWLPGDLIYPLKTVSESAILWATPGAVGQARLHIDYAQRRLLEVQALALECRYEEIPLVVVNFGYHAERAVLALNGVAGQDPAKAKLLAYELQAALHTQSGLVRLLGSFAPEYARADLEQVRLISENAVLGVQDLLSPSSGQEQSLTLQNCWD